MTFIAGRAFSEPLRIPCTECLGDVESIVPIRLLKWPLNYRNLFEMKTTTPIKQSTKAGSIAVSQPIKPNRRPPKIAIIRAIYESCQGPDGKKFGRSRIVWQLRIPSGTEVLDDFYRAKLVEGGFSEKEIDYVNMRLAKLAGPARESALSMDLMDVAARLKYLLELSNSETELAKALHMMLADALEAMGARLVANDGPAESELKSVPEILKDTLTVFNNVCADAQRLYKRLPKGELSDGVLLEFQKSWFSYQDMLNTFKNRKCFSRPSRWTALRTQVLDGRLYKYGDPVPEGRLVEGSETYEKPETRETE